MIRWSSHIRKKSSFFCFYGLVNNAGEALKWNWQSVTTLNEVKNAIMKWHTFWMAPCLIFYFFVILFYIERKWLLTRKLVTILPLKFKLSRKFQRFNAIERNIKMLKNSWIFICKAETVCHLKEVIQPIPLPSHPIRYQIKPYYVCGTKRFFKEIYRNIQAFAFKELQKCSSWASRNGAVQIFFLGPKGNMLDKNL